MPPSADASPAVPVPAPKGGGRAAAQLWRAERYSHDRHHEGVTAVCVGFCESMRVFSWPDKRTGGRQNAW